MSETETALQPSRQEEATPFADFRLSRDPADYERIMHDPAVLPFIIQKGQEPPQLASFFENPENIGFLFRDAAFLAHFVEPCVYEVHSAALPHVRGRYVSEAADISIRFMFLATPAMELLTRVVEGNVAALALTRKKGFAHEFDRRAAWQGGDGPLAVSFHALRYPEWVKRQDWLRTSGDWFHSMLGEEQTHEQDAAHDLFVGAAVETLLGGQPEKAVALYNRWARFAGYEPVSLVSLDPITINIVSHLVTVADGKVEILKCQ